MAKESLPGHDIFISYARGEGGTKYANGLSEALKARGFSCFIDAYGTEPSKDVPASLLETIRQCRMFVVVATPLAGKRPAVATELEAFLGTGRKTSTVPIDFGGSLSKADWYGKVEGVVPAFETEEALRGGQPSDEVVTRIANNFTFRRREEDLSLLARRERKYWGVLRVLAVAIVAALALLLFLLKLAGDARAEVQTLSAQAARAGEEARISAERAAQAWFDLGMASLEAVNAALEASKQQQLADAAAKSAEEKARLAAEAAARARAAEAARVRAQTEADRQQAIAASRSLANRSQTLLRQEPEELPSTVSYAVRALKTARTVEADTALRESLALMPRLDCTVTHEERIAKAALSPDGLHYATLLPGKGLRVYESGKPSPLPLPPGAEGITAGSRLALSNGGAYAAVASRNQVARLDLKRGGQRSFEIGDPARVEGLALSPDGEYMALAYHVVDPHYTDFPKPVLHRDRVLILDLSTGETATLPAEGDQFEVRDISFGPNGNLAALVWEDSASLVVTWMLSDAMQAGHRLGKADFSPPTKEYFARWLRAVAPGTDATYFATDEAVWKLTGDRYAPVVRIRRTENLFTYAVEDLAFSPDHQRLTIIRTLPLPDGSTWQGGRQLEIWDTAGHPDAAHTRIALDDSTSVGLAFTPGEEFVAVKFRAPSGRSGGVRLFRAADMAEAPDLGVPAGPVAFLSEDARHAVRVDRASRSAQVWTEWGAKQTLVAYGDSLDDVSKVDISPDGMFLALAGKARRATAEGAAGADQWAAVFYAREGSAYRTAGGPLRLPHMPTSIGLASGGRFLLVQDVKGALSLWDAREARDITPAGVRELYDVIWFDFSPRGHLLAAAGKVDGASVIRVWRAADYAELMSVPYGWGGASLWFSPRERYLMLTSVGAPPRLLDLSTKSVRELPGMRSGSSAVFSADERLLGVSADSVLWVYETADLDNEIAQLQHDGWVSAAAFSSDGQRVATVSSSRGAGAKGRALRVWLLGREALLDEAEQRLQRLPHFLKPEPYRGRQPRALTCRP